MTLDFLKSIGQLFVKDLLIWGLQLISIVGKFLGPRKYPISDHTCAH